MFNDQDIIDARGKLVALDRSQAVIQFDLTGHVVEANENFLDLFEYARAEVIGRHHSLFCEPEYVASPEYKALWAKLARGEHDAGQYKRISSKGRPVWIQSSYNPILDLQGRPRKIIKFATDISDRKAAEQALNEAKDRADAALRSKELFLSTMSHELRTPMNVIIGLGELLLDDTSLAKDHREQIDDIVKAGGHLLSLINDVLDLNQLESGAVTIRPSKVNVDSITEEALAMIKTLARTKRISLRCDPPCNGTVIADSFRLKQVLLNLMSNAVKYNRTDGTVQVSRTVRDQTLRISIQDTGPGIPADRLHELFQPFNRLGAEQTEIEGTGIGLSISKRMMEAMGGRIGLESAEGLGSCFWIELPGFTGLEPSEPAQPVKIGQAGGRIGSDGRARVLVAEDHLVNQKLIRRQLEKLGYECVVCMNGAEAEAALLAGRFDLLLSDLNMPIMDGYTLASRVRARGISSEELPIVFLTADVFNSEQDQWRRCGADAYLTKPTQVDTLAACLQSLLSR